MKQIVTSAPRPQTPSIGAQLRAMKVGSKAEIIVIGRVYNNYMSARSKLHRAGCGRWEHEFLNEGENHRYSHGLGYEQS